MRERFELGFQKAVEEVLVKERLVNEAIHQLNGKMSQLPKRWVQQYLQKNQIHFTETLAKEVVSQSEVKDLSHHMSLILSAPIDFAYAEPVPHSRWLLFFLFGGFLGAVMTFGCVVLNSLNRGVPATREKSCLTWLFCK